MQYHGQAMLKLVQDSGLVIRDVEPRYLKERKRDKNHGTLGEIDYDKVEMPATVSSEPERLQSNVFVKGEETGVLVYSGNGNPSFEVNMLRDISIKDCTTKHTRILYAYDGTDGQSSISDFSEFISKGLLGLVKEKEAKLREKLGADWKAPIIFTNDGQLGMASLLRNYPPYSEDQALQAGLLAFVTHTYGNRGIFEYEEGRNDLSMRGFTQRDIDWFARHAARDGRSVVDYSSIGLRCADVAFSVAKIHANEVNWQDPLVNLIAITNGDNRELTARVFRSILLQMYPGSDVEGSGRETPSR